MRFALKARTSCTHARLDDALSELSLAQRSSFITFLRTQHLAYRALHLLVPNDHWVSGVIDEMKALLTADLGVLDVSGTARPMIGAVPPMHPLGVAYVICGSHFGKRVLRSRWLKSADTAVLGACSYLDSDVLALGWKSFLSDLDELPDPARDLPVLAADADRTFSIFYDSLLTVKHRETAHAAA
ncbi:hypothetical protein [Yoonia sediminilitoris]|uniref:Heme oxygenase n=1 Tax=Yoonia sediminilitoris TaxID=1286148 RepID=A0A2T6KR29_9RHOB|nr:hypothetical protein [Yoonia sediminilitoris]PUB19014.1 heme oxygenase [Yoonia sediminilitoris]RCW99182.1 heme oxygenase [Yoonia sediminilitoris]